MDTQLFKSCSPKCGRQISCPLVVEYHKGQSSVHLLFLIFISIILVTEMLTVLSFNQMMRHYTLALNRFMMMRHAYNFKAIQIYRYWCTWTHAKRLSGIYVFKIVTKDISTSDNN